MRVSIVNCVSTAFRMMRFSDDSLFKSANHGDFDYVVVKWLADAEVEDYLRELPAMAVRAHPRCRVHILEHLTDESVGYVPNLRAMMNLGFDFGFLLNQYAGLVNTDCYFGPGWLDGLVRHVCEDGVVNSLHVTAAVPPRPVEGIVTANFGIPTPETFDLAGFASLYERYYEPRHTVSARRDFGGDYRQCATMPYLFHRKYWGLCGPWELTLENGTPDVRFFDRVYKAGADFLMTKSSVVYHHEAVERRGKRPKGSEHMPNE